MIASLVITMEPDFNIKELVGRIAQVGELEVGELEVGDVEVGECDANSRRVPVVVESPGANDLEQLTERLQHIAGVAFVDVVFVHFEDGRSAHPSEPVSSEPVSIEPS